MSNTKETTQIKVRMTPEEIERIDAEKPANMTRAAWAKRRLLEPAKATTTGAPPPEAMAAEFVETRDLIREKNRNLAQAMGLELRKELGNMEFKIAHALEKVEAVITRAAERGGR